MFSSTSSEKFYLTNKFQNSILTLTGAAKILIFIKQNLTEML